MDSFNDLPEFAKGQPVRKSDLRKLVRGFKAVLQPGQFQSGAFSVQRKLGGQGGGAVNANVALAFVTSEAPPSTYGDSNTLSFGGFGKARVLRWDGGQLVADQEVADDVLYRNIQLVKHTVGRLVRLHANAEIKKGDDENDIWGEYVNPVDFYYELPGVGGMKALNLPVDATKPMDQRWDGVECG